MAAVGDGVDPWWIGRRVWAFVSLQGGYAERAVAPAAALVPLPVELPAADAVTLGTSGIVAHFALRHAHFAAGETVLVRGAAGGIGIMTVQVAIRAGAPGEQEAPAGFDVIVDMALFAAFQQSLTFAPFSANTVAPGPASGGRRARPSEDGGGQTPGWAAPKFGADHPHRAGYGDPPCAQRLS